MKTFFRPIFFIKKKLGRLFSFSYISLNVKLFFCYLFLIAMMFLFLNTYANTAMQSKLRKDTEAHLYMICSVLSTELPKTISEKTITASEEKLKLTASLTDYRILAADKNGKLCFDSGTPNRTGTVISDFDKDFLTQTTIHDTTIHNMLPYHACAVIYPLTNDFQITGYFIALYPVSDMKVNSIEYTDIYNICFIYYSILLIFVFLVLSFMTVRPLKQNIKMLQSFSSGKYEDKRKRKIHTRDEYEELAETATFLAMELKNLEDYQKKFIANISHDLRSPLTSIKGYAEAMADGTIPPEMQDKYLNIIIYEATRLSKLSQSLLTLNSYETRNAMLTISIFDMNAMIRQTALSFEGTGRKKGIQIHLLFEEPSLFVSADKAKIEQVLYNLLDNAIKFSYENKTIRIATKIKGTKAMVSIKDNGIGIPKESLHKVFDRFYKIDSSRGRDKKGTGLGLAITKEIINAHKETITVVSTKGAGTEFTFSLSLRNSSEFPIK